MALRLRSALPASARPQPVTNEVGGSRLLGFALGLAVPETIDWLRQVTGLRIKGIQRISCEAPHSDRARRSDILVMATGPAGRVLRVRVECKGGATLTDSQAVDEAAASDALVVVAPHTEHLTSTKPANTTFTVWDDVAAAFARHAGVHLPLTELAATMNAQLTPVQAARATLQAARQHPSVQGALATHGVTDDGSANTAHGQAVSWIGADVGAGQVYAELQPAKGRVTGTVMLAYSDPAARDLAPRQRTDVPCYPVELARLFEHRDVRSRRDQLTSRLGNPNSLNGAIDRDVDRRQLIAGGIDKSQLFGHRMTGVSMAEPYLSYGVRLEAPADDPGAVLTLLIEVAELMGVLGRVGAAGDGIASTDELLAHR